MHIGMLLHQAWYCKQALAKEISTPHVNAIYGKALSLGALGGKLLGAGGGGFMLFIAPPEKHPRIIDGLNLLHVPFKFEHGGAQRDS